MERPDEAPDTLRNTITRLETENARLRQGMLRSSVTLASIGDAVVTTDAHGSIEFVNEAAEGLLGCMQDLVRGRLTDQLYTLRSAQTNAVLANPVHRCLDHGRTILRRGRSLLVVPGREPVMVQESVRPLYDTAGQLSGVVLILKDISLQTGLTEQLSWQSRHDSLTGLLNREEFERRLRQEIRRASSGGRQRHSLLYLDLDRFRILNDTSGHCAGDRLLLEIASLLQKHIRASDLPSRLGDDEFAVLLRDCPPMHALTIASGIREAIEAHRFVWRKRYFKHTASIGVVGIEQAMNCEDVLAAADVACYSAKEAGRNTVSLYCAEETPAGYRDMQWVSRIGRACDEDRFEMYCQEIVSIKAVETIPHYELLLRIKDRQGNIIPATDFLPAAERFNLMPTIDRWVLRYTLANLALRRRDVTAIPYMVSVNLSGASLSDQAFLDFARDQIEKADLSDNALCFEITETAAIDNIAAVVRFMREMRQLGCAFSLDDFGSGLSSFAYLKELPVDYLKIDGRFVSNVHEDQVDHTMVGAIGHIGTAIGVKTVAERVETSATLHRLQSLGIDFAQGYYFSRPLPVARRDDLSRLAHSAARQPQTA